MPAIHTYWVIDFRVISMLLPHLLIVLFLFPPLFIIQCLQVLLSVVFFHHFIFLELIMSLFIIVLQIVCGLDKRKNKPVDVLVIEHTGVIVSTGMFLFQTGV